MVLASTSATRAALLSAAGVAFEPIGSDVDEAVIKDDLAARGASPREVALALAQAKALAVSRRAAGLVIGADQTLDLDGAVVDKAADLDEARLRLRSLRGRDHQLHAAVALAREGELLWSQADTATLSMRAFSDVFLEAYLTSSAKAALGAVGGYHLEDVGIQLFDRIDGDYFAILGLPMLGLLTQLRRLGALAE